MNKIDWIYITDPGGYYPGTSGTPGSPGSPGTPGSAGTPGGYYPGQPGSPGAPGGPGTWFYNIHIYFFVFQKR